MKISKKKCVGCANCVPVCPMNAIFIGPDNLAEVDREACVECHTCFRGLSFEHLPGGLVRWARRALKMVRLRFQPDPDLCPTEALEPEKLEWPRIVRSAFSDPMVTHESTGIHGRGTAEAKTNDVTGRVGTGEAGFVVEFGRPGIGVIFRDVEKATRALAVEGVVFEPENPVTSLMTNAGEGSIREDILDEKILSCIVEFKTRMEDVPRILDAVKAVSGTLNTVVSIGVSTRCDEDGSDPLHALLMEQGYDTWRAKVNMGMGRRSNIASGGKGRRV
ncbi:MAG: hypothetical protein A2X56_04635 [Nitrospirae bacterium GWC2_57_13]|jgi:ferredoxin|nr:MAG: hypothetical protein A2X56_04635 [Nitrospirae bacterium GWC2_57_13]